MNSVNWMVFFGKFWTQLLINVIANKKDIEEFLFHDSIVKVTETAK